MRSPIILDMFRQYGIRAFAPALQSVKDSVASLIEHLQAGNRANVAEQLHELATKELQDACARNAAVCLACTELPLAFDGLTQEGVFEWHGTTYINTTAIHSRAAVDYALGRFQIHEPGTDQSGK
jgi:aspartate racemase